MECPICVLRIRGDKSVNCIAWRCIGKGLRFAESIEHVIQCITVELCYVNMEFSQRYEAEYISKTIKSRFRSRCSISQQIATFQITSNTASRMAIADVISSSTRHLSPQLF